MPRSCMYLRCGLALPSVSMTFLKKRYIRDFVCEKPFIGWHDTSVLYHVLSMTNPNSSIRRHHNSSWGCCSLLAALSLGASRCGALLAATAARATASASAMFFKFCSSS